MTGRVVSLLLSAIVLVSCGSEKTKGEKEWVSLSGEDFAGWTIKMGGQELKEDREGAYRVEDGILKIYDSKQDTRVKVGHLFYKTPYSSFRLRFDYRFTGRQFKDGEPWPEQYGGVVFHSQSPQSMGREQEYPVCLEFQLLGGKQTGQRSTGNVCTIGTLVETGGGVNPAHCINSGSPAYEGDRWVRAELEVWSDSLVRHYIEGEMVLEYRNPQIGGGFVSENFNWEKGNVKDAEEWIRKEGTRLGAGYIGIQAHDPMEIRKIELMELK